MTEPKKDPRLEAVLAALDALWEDEDSVPTGPIEAVTALDAADRWDLENGVQRTASEYIASLLADLSKARAALEAAVMSFELVQRYEVRLVHGEQVITAANTGHPMPAVETVKRWRVIAEGGQ